MDQRTRMLIDKIGIALSLILGLLAVVGEFLGWWNDAGVVLSIFSLVLGVLSVLDMNGSQILNLVDAGLGPGGWLRRHHDALRDNQASMLENQASMGRTLDNIEALLDQRLPDGG